MLCVRVAARARIGPDYFKFNFQATKKLWALAQMRAALVLVLDSDFLVTRPIHLKTMIDRYSGVLYETSTSLEAFDDRVVATTNELLGVRSDRFLMEPPWIFRPPLVRQLLQLILHRSLSGMLPSAGKLPPLPPQGSPKGSQLEETPQSAAQHLPHLRDDPLAVLLMYPAPCFEICVYNLYVSTYHGELLTRRFRVENLKRRRHVPPHRHRGAVPAVDVPVSTTAVSLDADEQPGGLLFERHMSDAERAQYEPPPPATTR